MPVETFQMRDKDRDMTFVMDLDPKFTSDWWILHYRMNKAFYEPDVSDAIGRLLKPGQIAVDVGANVGFFSLMMARIVGETGKVLAFEPGSNNMPKFRKNAELNSPLPQLHYYYIALSDHAGTAKIYLNADNSGGNSLWDAGLWHENEKTRENPKVDEVPMHMLDDLAQHADLIKVDTEGAEELILRGARVLLANDRPNVIAEFNLFGSKQLGSSPDTLRNFMLNMGYDCFALHTDGSLPTLLPWNLKVAWPGTMNVLFSTQDRVGEAWSHVGS